MTQAVSLRREEGFWSTFVLLFVVTLGLLGVGAHKAIMSEGPNIARNVTALQAAYSADGGAYLAIRAISRGKMGNFEGTTFDVAGADVTMDTTKGSKIGYPDLLITCNTKLTVNASKGGFDRSIQVWSWTRLPLSQMAVLSAGVVTNIVARDSAGAVNSQAQVQNAKAVNIPLAGALNALSTSQGHNQSVTPWSPAAGYPSASFYNAGTTPNVTHVSGDMSLAAGRTIYGIFVVEGSVTMATGSQVIGVIYCPNNSAVTINNPPAAVSVTGGIITGGTVTATASSTVRNNMTYMTVFSRYLNTLPDNAIMYSNGWTFSQ